VIERGNAEYVTGQWLGGEGDEVDWARSCPERPRRTT
jgi:hypothetical protein